MSVTDLLEAHDTLQSCYDQDYSGVDAALENAIIAERRLTAEFDKLYDALESPDPDPRYRALWIESELHDRLTSILCKQFVTRAKNRAERVSLLMRMDKVSGESHRQRLLAEIMGCPRLYGKRYVVIENKRQPNDSDSESDSEALELVPTLKRTSSSK